MEIDQLTRLLESAVGFRAALSSAHSGWQNIALYNWNGVVGECAFEVFNDPCLIFHAGGAPICSINIEGRGASRFSSPGLMTFVPPETPVRCRFNGKVVSFSLHFNSTPLDAEPYRQLSRLEPSCGFRDDLLAASVRALVDEVMNPREYGPLYADTLGESMALHLLRNASSISEARAQALTRRTLQRTLDAIEASIETGISLTELACIAQVSRGHFAKAFKESTGMPPHTYLTQRRIRRAQDLLKTDACISDVALRCGFSSQAHFTVCFRRHTGHTPRAYRKAMC